MSSTQQRRSCHFLVNQSGGVLADKYVVFFVFGFDNVAGVLSVPLFFVVIIVVSLFITRRSQIRSMVMVNFQKIRLEYVCVHFEKQEKGGILTIRVTMLMVMMGSVKHMPHPDLIRRLLGTY